MNAKNIQALYGLKWNPFTQDIPNEAIFKTPRFAQFCYRVETLTLEGGFALITGASGLGKSTNLRALYDHLSKIPEITVGDIIRPQSGLSDFYREMGTIFGIELRNSNRWGGYKGLREKWRHHIASTLLRPVLLIDEAQEMPPAVLSELRLLTIERFDSVCLLTIVLAGDVRLTNAFKEENLIPLGTRMRTRLAVEPWMKPQLIELLREAVRHAGNPNLVSAGLIETLAEHAAGSPRVMMNLAADCLAIGALKEMPKLDEGLFFELFPQQNSSTGPRRKSLAQVAAK
ncbi:MAG: ATP-binding protein [Deltaproteobacteria bacterium]|nr:ATP-binding protein [Deltaproteobacteria bacterium]